MKLIVILSGVALLALLAVPPFARVESYGPTQYTRVGHHAAPGHGHVVVIDRSRGPGWAGALVGGAIGAAAGPALAGPHRLRPHTYMRHQPSAQLCPHCRVIA